MRPAGAHLPDDCARRFAEAALLGEGGHGVVYRARDRSRGVDVAVKVLLTPHDPETVKRFIQEARVASRLVHPGIVRVIDAGDGAGVPWIAYELLSGLTLRQHLDRGRLGVATVIAVGRQVADALAFAHGQKVLHRDVKPDNVMESGDGHWKLVDFGIAKVLSQETVRTATGVILGTPSYIAPEQVRGEPPSLQSDLYSLGVMLYELITGNPPFTGASPLEILKAHLEQSPPPLRIRFPEIPVSLEDVILALLAKDPRQRPESAEAAALALARAADRVGAATTTLARESAVPPPSARRRGGAAVLALAALFLCLLAWAGRGPRPIDHAVLSRTIELSPRASPAPSRADAEALLARFNVIHQRVTNVATTLDETSRPPSEASSASAAIAGLSESQLESRLMFASETVADDDEIRLAAARVLIAEVGRDRRRLNALQQALTPALPESGPSVPEQIQLLARVRGLDFIAFCRLERARGVERLLATIGRKPAGMVEQAERFTSLARIRYEGDGATVLRRAVDAVEDALEAATTGGTKAAGGMPDVLVDLERIAHRLRVDRDALVHLGVDARVIAPFLAILDEHGRRRAGFPWHRLAASIFRGRRNEDSAAIEDARKLVASLAPTLGDAYRSRWIDWSTELELARGPRRRAPATVILESFCSLADRG